MMRFTYKTNEKEKQTRNGFRDNFQSHSKKYNTEKEM